MLFRELSWHALESSALPPAEDRFKAFELIDPQEVRVVILGQDPYHRRGQAMGLSFSVNAGQPVPKSLRNILKEYSDDLNLPLPCNGDLTVWADRGVLLLNRVLTVSEGRPRSLRGMGWEAVTDHVIQRLAEKNHGMVFILWGSDAQKVTPLITDDHLILESAHPSPLSAYRGFFGSKPFSKVNEYFSENGLPKLNWSLSSHLPRDFKRNVN